MYRFSIRIPDRNQLIVDIDNLKSNIQIGKKYGVSDNTIKKWKTKYNLWTKHGDIAELERASVSKTEY